MKEKIYNIKNSLLNIIYPENNICMICDYIDKEIEKKYICSECILKFKKLKGRKCKVCSKPLVSSNEICIECIETTRYFKKVWSIFEYKGATKELIADYKYNNKPYYYKMIGSILYNYIIINNITVVKDFDIITFVPLHKNKKKKRGYNQSELIAKYIGKKLKIRCEKLINRTIDTVPQNQLNKEQRKRNLKNTFEPIKIIKNKNILIVDDVYTTGTTINECSKVLLNAGAQNICGITLAR